MQARGGGFVREHTVTRGRASLCSLVIATQWQ
jgi:hypothetical protein